MTPGPAGVRRSGVAFAAASALCYGTTVVFGRSLAKSGLSAPAVLGVRFGLAALFMGLLVAASRTARRGPRPTLLNAFLLGLIGYASQAALFFAGLRRGTAAAVTLLFYVFPAIVVVLEVPLRRQWPRRATLGALALCTAGTAAIVAASGDVTVSRTGVLFALGAGASFALYVIGGDRAVHGLDPRLSALGVTAGTASGFLVFGAATSSLAVDARWWPQLAGNGVASALAFAFLFAALPRLGASDTSIVMTLEALFAALLAAVILGESATPAQVAGGVAILVGAVLIGVSRRDDAPAPVEVPA